MLALLTIAINLVADAHVKAHSRSSAM
jgi:hypothetical protein